jgi:hypothetical protein
VPEGDAGLRSGFLKRVKIHHDHVDGLNAVGRDGRFVPGVAANVKQATMDARMQRLHAAVEHLWESGELADVLDCKPGRAQRIGCAAGGDQLHAESGKRAGKFHQAGFVGHAQ